MAESSQPVALPVSPTVERVREKHRLAGEVTAFALARELLALHPEYGRDAHAPDVSGDPVRAERRSADEWLAELTSLFDRHGVPVLDGRLALLGLALLEPRLARRLRRGGFLASVETEIRKPFASLLTERGREAQVKLQGKPESVLLLSDRPAEVDQLNRVAFAEALADRIRLIRSRDCRPGAFLVHIYGAVGVGKTSLLHFIANELRHPRAPDDSTEKSWVVVDFNAWEHQRIAPPWWWLMTAVYRGALRELRTSGRWWQWLKLHLWDLWWRVRDGWSAYILFPLALVGLWLLWKYGLFGDQEASLVTAAKDAGTVAGVAVTVWGLVHGLSRWLLLGSPRGAVAVMQRTRDPMGLVTRRFEFLIKKIEEPVGIFIDDLDRCRGAYIVELLEGIQTLFVSARVTYVVAADRGWLCESYAKVYADFASRIDEPGRPLGYHFLEKTFQLSVAMPRMTPELRRAYLDRLLGIGSGDGQADHEAARREAEKLFAALGTEQDVRSALERHSGHFGDEQALREAAVSRLASSEVHQRTEHTLKSFADLLEANPRAMKRLINAYGVESALQLLQADEVDGDPIRMEQLVLWTILMLRWPILADFLGDHPKAIELLREGKVPPGVPNELEGLFTDEDVQQVVLGEAESVDASLDEEAIRAYAGLSEAESSALRKRSAAVVGANPAALGE